MFSVLDIIKNQTGLTFQSYLHLDWPIFFLVNWSNFNIAFCSLLCAYFLIKREINIKALAYLLVIAIVWCVFVFNNDQIISINGLINPQLIPFSVLTLLFVTITTLTISFKRFRTRNRIFISLIATAVFCSWLFSHTALITTKLKESNQIIEDNHSMSIASSLETGSVDEFFMRCHVFNLSCYTEQGDQVNEEINKKTPINPKEFIDSSTYGFSSVISTGTDGEVFQAILIKTKLDNEDKYRMVVDVDLPTAVHSSTRLLMYTWFVMISSFWMFGGLFVMHYHNKKLNRKPRKSLKGGTKI